MRLHRHAVLVRLDAVSSPFDPTRPTNSPSSASWRLHAGRLEIRRSQVWTGPILALAVLGIAMTSPLIAVGGPAGTLVARVVIHRMQHRRDARRRDRQVIDLVDRLGQQVRAGVSLAAAIERVLVAPSANSTEHVGEMQSVFVARFVSTRRALASGESMPVALARVDTADLASLDLLVAALVVLLRNGGPVAVALDRIGETLRAGIGARDEAAAQSGQAVASAGLLSVLPFAFAGVVALVEPNIADFYLSTWAGAGCLLAAGAASTVSWFWIDWAVHR